MKVSVFGLGYVGAVTSACLSRDGMSVVGVDVNPEKVEMVASGKAPIIEPELAELLEAGVKSGRVRATISPVDAVTSTDVSFISVGTPSQYDGSLDVSRVFRVCEIIGEAIAAKAKPHVVAIRSTVLPGTTQHCAELLRKKAGSVGVPVAFNPEFLREGSAIRDYDAPPYTIIGTDDVRAEQTLRQIYRSLTAPVIVTEMAVAESIKLVSNAWHAAKIVFANEISRLSQAVGLEAHKVMEVLAQDTKLNVSSAYMRPGFAYGGSCLPKDVRALNYFARVENIDLPLLASLVTSNMAHIESALQQVLATEKRRVGMLGLAFKAGTDDLRESPAVELAERLLGKGCDLLIFDEAVRQSKLVGANRAYVESKIPHLSRLLAGSSAELVRHAELVVVTYDTAEFRQLLGKLSPDVPVIDLTGAISPVSVSRPLDRVAL